MAVKQRGCATYETTEIPRSELLGLPRHVHVPDENADIYNFPTAQGAIGFINGQHNINKREGGNMHAEIWIHGSENDLPIRLFHDSSHQHGVTIGYLAEFAKSGFSRFLRAQAEIQIGDPGPIDFYQIKVYH